MALVTHSGKDKIFGMIEQTTWKTAVDDGGTTGSPSSTITEVDCEPFTIDFDVKVREQSGFHATRTPTYSDMQTDEKGSIPKFSVTADAKQDDVDMFVYPYFQNVTEGATTPYAKTFTFPVTSPHQPDFTDSAGIFYTWFEHHPTASTSHKVHDAICSKLTFSCSPGERLKVATDWMCNTAGSTTSNVAGGGVTWNRPALEYYYYEEVDVFTVNINAGGVQNLVGVGDVEISFEQELVPVGHDGSGSSQTFAIVERKGTFKFTINNDTVADAIKAGWKADNSMAFRYGFGNATPGTVDGDLDIAFTGKVEKCEPDNNNVLGLVVTGKILAPTGATTSTTIIIANDIDRTW